VAPVAEELRAGRLEVARTARKLLPEHWSMPSPLEGWTYKDLLAHLANGDWVFQSMLLGVLGEGEPVALKPGFDVNAGNAKLVEERKERPVEELIAEVESEGEATQELLARLPEDLDRGQVVGRMRDGTPVTVEMWLQGFPRHDAGHGAQLKAALDQVMM
jgi:uncharacterized protein (TIGR03083 family)